MNPRKILIVDCGLAFGGTVVVAANLMRGLDGTGFVPILVSAASSEFVQARTREKDHTIIARPRLTYQGMLAIKAKLQRRLPTFLLRPAYYVLSAVAALVNISYAVRIASLILRERVEIVHCNNYLANIEAALVATILRRRMVLHAHGMITVESALGSLLRRASGCPVIAISAAVRDSLVGMGVPSGQVVVLHNPVDAVRPSLGGRSQFRASNGIPKEALLIAVVGRVVPWKGQLEFLNAVMPVLRKLPHAHAAIIGDASDGGAEYLNALKAVARKSDVELRIHFVGYVSDTASMYEAIDVLAHTSIEPEPFGLVVSEAMASGVAVVAANTGAPPEFVQHAVTGLLVDPEDREALSKALLLLATNDEFRNSLAQAGRRYAVEAFDANAYAKRMLSVYRSGYDKRTRGGRE